MTTGDDRSVRPENIGDRLTLLETAVSYLVTRQGDREQLIEATDNLSDSTGKLEQALREVGQLRARQDEIKGVQSTLKTSVDQVVPKVADLERNSIPRWRRIVTAAGVTLLALLAVASLIDRHHLHQQVTRNQHLICQAIPHDPSCHR